MFVAAFSASDLASIPDADERASVRALTERIADACGSSWLKPTRSPTRRGRSGRSPLRLCAWRLVAAGRAAHRGGGSSPAASSGLDGPSERYERLLLRLRRYDERLRSVRLHDRHLELQVSTRDATVFGLREIALGSVLLPLARWDWRASSCPTVDGQIARRVARERDVLATAQVFTGAVYASWCDRDGDRVVALWAQRRLARARGDARTGRGGLFAISSASQR